LTRKISKLNMHSIGKKSSRISQKLFSSMGLESMTPDYSFEDLDRKFSAVQRAVNAFCAGAQRFREALHEVALTQFNVSENVTDLYGGGGGNGEAAAVVASRGAAAAARNVHGHRQKGREVGRFRKAHHNIISTYWNQYVSYSRPNNISLLKFVYKYDVFLH